MKNFGRLIKIALRNRLSVAATLGCAICVAILWGGNISAVYPFVEVVFRGQSMRDWVDGEIAKANDKQQQLAQTLADLESRQQAAPEAGRGAFNTEIDLTRYNLQMEQQAERLYARLRPFVHKYLPDDPFSTLLWVVAFLVLGTTIKLLFMVLSTILTERIAQRAAMQLRKTFYRRTLRMDLASFSKSGTNELISRFTHDLDSASVGLRIVFGRAIREPLKMLACFAGAAFICWRLLIISLLLAPLAAFGIRKLSKSIKRANRRAMEEMSQLYNALAESLSGIKAVKAFTMERHERWRFHQICKQYYLKSMKIARYDALIRPCSELTGILTICVAFIAGAYLVLNQQTHLFGIRITDRELSISQLLLFYGLLAGTSDPARKLSDIFNCLQRASAACDRIYQMLDRETSIQQPSRPLPLPRHSRQIRFENVHFSYQEHEPLLEAIDLEIGYGETVAIVGPNGCGKSTLLNLLPRFYDPKQGRITIDGVDIRDVRLRTLRKQFGIVLQESLLFNDSIYNNIRYGDPSASREQVLLAARKAHANRFIDQLEEGYETVVGQHGNRLSGGQRQRIALARAILRDPAILILDEATSQVDLESEQLIHEALAEFMQDRTALVITHRLATLTLADRIVVMEAGRISDFGTHEELLRRCELYQRLCHIGLREAA